VGVITGRTTLIIDLEDSWEEWCAPLGEFLVSARALVPVTSFRALFINYVVALIMHTSNGERTFGISGWDWFQGGARDCS